MSFTYGPDGSRLKKSSASGETLYLGSDIERGPNGAWTKYVHPDAIRSGTGPSTGSGGSVTTWLHRDHSRSVRLRTNSAGGIVERALYTPYGRPAPGLTISRGYIGERHDADLGLQNLNARMYDPAGARFLSPDD